jgi:hypothetical protein
LPPDSLVLSLLRERGVLARRLDVEQEGLEPGLVGVRRGVAVQGQKQVGLAGGG